MRLPMLSSYFYDTVIKFLSCFDHILIDIITYESTHRMKLPVPAGFIVTTETCLEYYHNNVQMSTQLVEEYTHAVHELEKQTGRLFPCK